MRVQHNIMAMNSYRNYNNNANKLGKNLEKLSSGYRINRAGDDAAGLAISEKMRAQITGLDAAQKNVQDGISLVKTAEGAMQEIHDMLNRMDYLATQSANGTYDNEVDRANLQKEVASLKEEIDRIADSANFNGIKLLDGSLAGDSQVKNVSMDLSVALKGKYETGTITKLDDNLKNLTKDDIGKTIDYTFTWKDASGTEKTTTVSLTFQGDGTGAVADTSSGTTAVKNYFTDASGTEYKMTASGTLDATTIEKALMNGLKADKEFSENFDISSNASKLVLEAKNAGSKGAVLTGVSLDESTSLDKTDVFSAAASATIADEVAVNTAPLDSMQKFAVANLKVADKSLTKEEIDSKIFEIDGHKFLLNSGAAKLTNDQIKALGDDVTIIDIAAGTAATGDAENIAAQITRVTGLATKAYTANGPTGSSISAGDIVFTEDTLNLSGTAMTLQIGDTADKFNQMKVKIGDMHVGALGVADLDISNLEGAQKAIDKIRAAINTVSSVRGDLGAVQNRLEHTANNLSVMEENIQNAESAIRDTDIADEMTTYTKNNILLQSAQAMLAQANQVPQGVLQLLQ